MAGIRPLFLWECGGGGLGRDRSGLASQDELTGGAYFIEAAQRRRMRGAVQ